MITTTEPALAHRDGCTGTRTRVIRTKYGEVFERCGQCRASIPRDPGTFVPEDAPTRSFTPDPTPTDLDWHSLVASAERRRVPVLRIDEHGDPHLIRSVLQLRSEWEDD